MGQISDRSRGVDEEYRNVEQAVRRFYDGIEAMARGEGAEKIRATWHHTDQATVRHPIDEWCVGWEEVWETWKFGATLGAPERGGTKLLRLRCFIYGDVAYATVTFQMPPALGSTILMCTNVLSKEGGEWKIVHHHADPSPGMEAALEQMLRNEDRLRSGV